MRISNRFTLIGVVMLSFTSICWYVSQRSVALPGPPLETRTKEALREFADIQPIDVHTHVFKDDPTFQAFLDRMHLTLETILAIDDTTPYLRKLEPQHRDALAAVRASRGHIALCTTFDPYKFANRDFAEQAIEQLNQDFAQGAVAVKIWKNLGMEIKKADGAFLMPDDPVLEPIYKDIEEHHRTLIAHLADPDPAWEPPPCPDDQSHLGVFRRLMAPYYTNYPAWYMYRHWGYPSKQAILAARDHLVEVNPHLRVVGAHLGSMSTDVNQIAERLDKYPNFAVELGGRTVFLALQPREKVRAFLIKYQDRVLYGTDLRLHVTENVQDALKIWERTYARDWEFFATNNTVQVEGHQAQGLGLPASVLRKIFRQNAVHWIPGIVAQN